MTQAASTLKLKVEASSKTATILAVVTALAGLIVGLGFITSAQEGLLIATTTSGLAVASLIANAIHTGQIEPSAFQVAILTLAGQALALLVSFLVIKEATAQHVTVIVTAVVFAAIQIAHALLSRKVEPVALTATLGEFKARPVELADTSIKALAVAIRAAK